MYDQGKHGEIYQHIQGLLKEREVVLGRTISRRLDGTFFEEGRVAPTLEVLQFGTYESIEEIGQYLTAVIDGERYIKLNDNFGVIEVKLEGNLEKIIVMKNMDSNMKEAA